MKIYVVMLDGISSHLPRGDHTYKGLNKQELSWHKIGQQSQGLHVECWVSRRRVYLPAWVYDCYVTKATPGRRKSFYDPLSLPIYGGYHLSHKENWKLRAFLPPILVFSFILESERWTTKLREIQSHGSHLLSPETLKAGFRACTVQFARWRLDAVKEFGSIH